MGKLTRLSFASILMAVAPFARADVEGIVVRVSDGDTLTVLDSARMQHKVRLAGIDAPEKGQPFASRSKQSLSECAFGRNASVIGHKLDRYGRLVGKVVVDGADCNLLQVQRGLAWHYKQYRKEQPSQDRLAYARAEDQAREHAAGLWRDTLPQPPWEYRRERR
jgi:endonuclease YncB( thermonuclease family)